VKRRRPAEAKAVLVGQVDFSVRDGSPIGQKRRQVVRFTRARPAAGGRRPKGKGEKTAVGEGTLGKAKGVEAPARG